MQNEKSVIPVIKILKRKRSRFATPALTEIAEQTESPFHVLVSCILSLRTKDETTARVSKELYKIADNPYDMAKLSKMQIAKIIRPVNYYRTKAKRIKDICVRLVSEFDGKVPGDIDTLLTFKGVGRKTANIVVVYGFKKEGMPIDTHCHRIPNRLGWVKTKTPEKTEQALRVLIPKKYWMDFNDLFVQFGQNICKPVSPKCDECPVSKHCEYYRTVYARKRTP